MCRGVKRPARSETVARCLRRRAPAAGVLTVKVRPLGRTPLSGTTTCGGSVRTGPGFTSSLRSAGSALQRFGTSRVGAM